MKDSIRPPKVMLKSTVTLVVDIAREALRNTMVMSTDSPASTNTTTVSIRGSNYVLHTKGRVRFSPSMSASDRLRYLRASEMEYRRLMFFL